MNSTELYKVLEEQYFGLNMHEQEEIELLPGLLKGVKTFVDVGASLGPYSFHASKILQGGKIICIEADPVRFRRLKELAETWQAASGNLFQVIHAAAADTPGKMEFFSTGDCISGALFKHHVPDPALSESLQWSKTEVDAITLDGLFPDTDPDLIKMDVEGAEYRVLLGARGILQRGQSRFLVEVHPWGDEPIHKTPADVFNLFAQSGYDFQRTHRHWHFFRSHNSLKRYVKNRLIVFVMNHAWVKASLKKAVLAVSKFTRRRQPVP